jgi:hypothetical protein
MRTIKLFFFTFLLCCFTANLFAIDYYWVGGGGTWSISKFSTTDGGTANVSQLPTGNDNVYFTALSGFNTANQTITIPSGGVFCKNISFSGCPFPPRISMGIGGLTVSGSMLLQNGMQVNYSGTNEIVFTSTGIETIQTNGASIRVSFRFTGSGTWTILDDLNMIPNVPTDGGRWIYLTNGKVIFDNRTVKVANFSCSGTGQISMLNTYFKLNRWQYSSAAALTAAQTAGSTIDMSQEDRDGGVESFSTTNGSEYYNLLLQVNANSTIGARNINQGTFNKIHYTSVTGNLGANGPITTDTLILNGQGRYTFANDISVNEYLEIKPAGCGGWIDIASNTEATTKTITMSAGSNVQLAHVGIKNMIITGFGTPYPVTNGIDNGGNTGWNFLPNTVHNTYYWVGGSGNWTDANHWANSSGGMGGTGCVPTPFDNAVFDDGSGFAAGNSTVLLDQAANCDTLLCIGTSITPMLLDMQNNLTVYGSLEFQRGMRLRGTTGQSMPVGAALTMVADSLMESIRLNGTVVRGPIYFQLRDTADHRGGWNLQDSLVIQSRLDQALFASNSSMIYFYSGNLNFNGQYVGCFAFDGGANNTAPYNINRTLNIANATIEVGGSTNSQPGWRYQAGQPLTATQSQNSLIRRMNTNGFIMVRNGDWYNNVEFTGTLIVYCLCPTKRWSVNCRY